MPEWMQLIITVLCSIAASSGFWAYVIKRSDKKDANTRMILGLGHDRLVYLCLNYIKKQEITKEEYENLHKYLYLPYKELGGNGMVDIFMDKIKTLPITGGIN